MNKNKDKLLIGISGASHTGKTTVAKILVDKYGFYDNTDFVTKHYIPKYGFPETTIEDQLQIVKVWKSVVDLCTTHQVIDRTPLDHLIYARMFHTISPNLLHIAWECLTKINLLIILPVVVWKQNTKQRYNKDIQKQYQQQLEWFIKDYDCMYTGWSLNRGLLSNANRRVLYTTPPKISSMEDLLEFADHEVWSYMKVNNYI